MKKIRLGVSGSRIKLRSSHSSGDKEEGEEAAKSKKSKKEKRRIRKRLEDERPSAGDGRVPPPKKKRR